MSQPPHNELEDFRRQWQAEVSSRRRRESRPLATPGPSTAATDSSAGPSDLSVSQPDLRVATTKDGYHEGWLEGGSYNFDDIESREEARRLGVAGTGVHPEARREPQTALEHFEHAVEKEGQGNMQESLIHYRKAYKLDDQVDRAYRNKHFPPSKFPSKTTKPKSTQSPANHKSAQHALRGSESTFSELVASFAQMPVLAQAPDVEGDPPNPCHIASLPHEILIGVFMELALVDVAALMRASLVCKHLAYVTHAEDPIWRRVCHESKPGFKDMKYNFNLTHQWQDLPRTLDEDLNDLSITDHDEGQSRAVRILPTLSPLYPSFLETFHSRPRIRFSGVYISTVNYVRSGMTSSNSVYWGNSPVHMVTYYRYLRFYRDGSAVSLLTFFEPHDVVPLLSKENLLAARRNSKDPLPSGLATAAAIAQASSAQGQGTTQPPTALAVMREARKARWRMSPLHEAIENNEATKSGMEPEGNVYVELEGPTRAYTYHMQLALRSVKAPTVAKNTKLAWRSFWSYNNITDDWGEFTLKNDRAYVFSRVKSWVGA